VTDTFNRLSRVNGDSISWFPAAAVRLQNSRVCLVFIHVTGNDTSSVRSIEIHQADTARCVLRARLYDLLVNRFHRQMGMGKYIDTLSRWVVIYPAMHLGYRGKQPCWRH
jgi:hypothetical protein